MRDIGDARIELQEIITEYKQPSKQQADRRMVRSSFLAYVIFLAALFGLVAGYFVFHRSNANISRPKMRFSTVTNFSGLEGQPTLSPDARSVAFVSNRGGQPDIWVTLISGGSLVRITNDDNLETYPQWSPDGARIAFGRMNDYGLTEIWTVPALGGTPRKILTDATDAAWSPDGRSLAYVNLADGTVWICDASGVNARRLTQPAYDRSARQLMFSRDGKRIAFVHRSTGPYGELTVTEIASGETKKLTKRGAQVISPVWSADDQFLYFSSSHGGTLNLWRMPADGDSMEQITAGQGDDAELDISADGKRIVFSTSRLNVNLAEISLNTPAKSESFKWLTTDASRTEAAPVYSPDGNRIAYFTARKGIEREGVWIMNSDGSNHFQLYTDEKANLFPRWTSNGESIVFSSRAFGPDPLIELWQMRITDTIPKKYPLFPAATVWGDVSHDGRIVLRSKDGPVQIFDPKLNKFENLNIQGTYHRWSPAGDAIAYFQTARKTGDPDTGLWIYPLKGSPRQLFHGWVTGFAWASSNEIMFFQGTPSAISPLWRVRLDGSSPEKTDISVPQIFYNYTYLYIYSRFDVHPDRQRIVVEMAEVKEADIGMIENIP
jgi:Tol biopolymer transport system component